MNDRDVVRAHLIKILENPYNVYTEEAIADAILDAINASIAEAFAARGGLWVANGVNMDAVVRGESGEVGSGDVAALRRAYDCAEPEVEVLRGHFVLSRDLDAALEGEKP